MSVNHALEAEKCLSKASWFRGEGPDAELVNPQSAAVFASLANAHATLAHLPEQQAVAVEKAARYERDLAATRRIVGDVIGETLVDGPPAAARLAQTLAYALRSRHQTVDGLIAGRMQALGSNYDPDAEVEFEEASPTRPSEKVPYHAAFLACRRALVDFLTDELSSMSNERWSAANRLATVLDGIGVNVDDDVDYQLAHQTDMGMTSRVMPSQRFPDLNKVPF